MKSPSSPSSPGRSCPLHYRYSPHAFAQAEAMACETLYVVGGLYGNEPALQQVLALFEEDRSPNKRLLFNGDFHWFDADSDTFERINAAVLQHEALRGNVETELADATASSEDAGCGCGYPAWVGDGVVERSNRILQRLRAAAPAQARAALAALPMWRRVDVGSLRVAVVHGDAESLAGWGFAVEHLRQPEHRATLQAWFAAAQVQAFACSHTCLPAFCSVPLAGGGVGHVLNNGAAGMPNFRDDGAGLITRISLRPYDGPARRHGVRHGAVHIDALAVDSATAAFREQFLSLWPQGSDAHTSYWARITAGPDHHPAQAVLTLR